MADEIDLANDLAEHSMNVSLQNIHNKVNSTVESEEFCIECDEEIPLARREAVKGCKRCVTCQSKIDIKQRLEFGR